jgi:hypothetical protein
MKALAMLAVLILVSGCRTAPPDVTTNYDPITGERTALMSENVLETPQNPPREVVWLNADHIYKDAWNRAEKTYLEVNYMAKTETGYLEIPVGATLLLTVDGQDMNFSGNGSFNKRKPWKKGFVRETALYDVSRTQLAKIAGAKQVKVKIKGNNGIVERDFAPDNFKRFQDFVAHLRG